MDVDFFNQPDVQDIMKKVPVDENLLAKDIMFREAVEDHIKGYFGKTSTKTENKVNSGFKYYAIGREQWKITAQETEFLRSKYESEIVDQLTKLQKQARTRTANK